MFRRFPIRCVLFSLAAAAVCSTGAAAPVAARARVEAIRYWSFGDVTRVAVQTEGDYRLTSDQVENPARIFFDLSGLRAPITVHHGAETIRVNDRRIKQIRVAEVSPGKTRIVFDLEGPAEVISSQLVNPNRLMIEVRPKGTSLPALSVAQNVTGWHSVTLGAPTTAGPVEPPLPKIAPYTRDAAVVANETPEISTAPKPTASLHVNPPDSLRERARDNTVAHSLPPTHAAVLQTQDGLVVQSNVPDSKLSASAHPMPGGTPALSPSQPKEVIGLATPAKRDSAGDRSLVRVFGLKLGRVVIDPGHGGHDTGTIGPNGLMEKELVLDVALRLGRLISQQLGAEVVYTRSDDTFVPLEERTKLANQDKADLFISIHANSSPEPTATGVETYFFNLNADKSDLDLAMRENATSHSSISDLNDILHRAVLQTKREESREFAQSVQTSLWATSVTMNSRSRDRGVRQAPFVVLIGATMPSILAEIGFVSNPHDEKLMRRSEERQRIAAALFKGVSQYANTLSHVQIARTGAE